MKVSRNLVTLTSHSDSHFEHSNTSFSENKLDGVDLNSNCRDCGVRKNRGKILWILADRIVSREYVLELAIKSNQTS